jgi:hypothetical protein
MAQTDFTVIEVVKSQQDEEVPEELYAIAPWWQWMFIKTHFYMIAQVRIPRTLKPNEEALLAEAGNAPAVESISYSTNTFQDT